MSESTNARPTTTGILSAPTGTRRGVSIELSHVTKTYHGQSAPTSGSIRIDGNDVLSLDPNELITEQGLA